MLPQKLLLAETLFPLIVVTKAEAPTYSVPLKSAAYDDTELIVVPLIFPPLRFVRAEMLVPDIVGESTSVALRSVNLADTALTEVPEIVTPRADVALKSTNLVVAEKFAAPVTVPPDNGK